MTMKISTKYLVPLFKTTVSSYQTVTSYHQTEVLPVFKSLSNAEETSNTLIYETISLSCGNDNKSFHTYSRHESDKSPEEKKQFTI